jgi:hypothetical protein
MSCPADAQVFLEQFQALLALQPVSCLGLRSGVIDLIDMDGGRLRRRGWSMAPPMMLAVLLVNVAPVAARVPPKKLSMAPRQAITPGKGAATVARRRRAESAVSAHFSIPGSGVRGGGRQQALCPCRRRGVPRQQMPGQAAPDDPADEGERPCSRRPG